MRKSSWWVPTIALTLSGVLGMCGGVTVGVYLAQPPGNTYTVDEFQDHPWPFNPGNGDTVNVRMAPAGDPAGRCGHMGGHLEGTLCLDVDF